MEKEAKASVVNMETMRTDSYTASSNLAQIAGASLPDDQSQGIASMSDVDFEAWLLGFLGGDGSG